MMFEFLMIQIYHLDTAKSYLCEFKLEMSHFLIKIILLVFMFLQKVSSSLNIYANIMQKHPGVVSICVWLVIRFGLVLHSNRPFG